MDILELLKSFNANMDKDLTNDLKNSQIVGSFKSGLDALKTFKSGKSSYNSGIGAFSKGFWNGAGKTKGLLKQAGDKGSLAGLALTAANTFIPQAKSDYNDGFGKALDVGSTVAGIGASLGLGALGPIGWTLGAASLANNLAGRKAERQGLDASTNVGSAYSGLTKDVASAGKRTTLSGNLFGYKGLRTNNINQKIHNLDKRRAFSSIIGNRNDMNNLTSLNSMQDVSSKNRNKLYNTFNSSILSAKNGAKLKNIITSVKNENKNVIPSGALHARKHSLPKEIAEQVTKKGIPVITKECVKDKCTITQHAEIEHSEIIFNKEVTDKLESLLKEGTDKAAIAAGKLLTHEILENTQDNTNLIETV